MTREPTPPVIRKAGSADLDRLVKLHHTSLAELAGGSEQLSSIRSGTFPSRDEIEETLNAALHDGEVVLLVADFAGQIAGMLHAVIETYGDELLAAPFLTVFHVATDPAFKNQGIATSLFGELESIAREHGIETIELLVWSTNTGAVKLYEKLGFGTVEHRMAKRVTSDP